MIGAVAAGVLATVALCSGASVVDHDRRALPAPSDRTAVSSVGESHVGLVTTVWRPR